MPAAATTHPRPTGANHSANKVQPQDRAIHEWYRFVLSYPPHLVRDYLGKFEATSGQTLLDPFAGTGTTVVEAKKLGCASVGLEGHPMAHFASSVKTSWELDGDALVMEAERIAELAAKALRLKRAPRDTLALYEETLPSQTKLKSLGAEETKLLLKDSISPLPLHKVLGLRDEIDSSSELSLRGHLRLALAKTIVTDASNLHFGPEVGLGDIKEDAPVIQSWLNRVYVMANDLSYVAGKKSPSVIHHGDARIPGDWIKPRSIDLVITSPPYPNEKDYTRTTRLESVLLGFVRTKAELRALKQGLIRSNTRNVYRADDDDQWVSQFESIQEIARAIEARRLELGKTSGFERLYHRVAKHYFGGMARHLANLRPLLRPGARLAYVVGDQASYLRIMIRTGKVLAEIAESLGYQVEGIDLFRTRLATATRATLREEVLCLKWTGDFKTHG